MTDRQDVSKFRKVLKSVIAMRGGHYIMPDENKQPIAALQIASISVHSVTGFGATEQRAQQDWLQKYAAHCEHGAAVCAAWAASVGVAQ
jgi:hypothetical protein